jgi:hypothetical protein
MNRAEVIARLKAAEPDLRAHSVAGLYLFGSYARDGRRYEFTGSSKNPSACRSTFEMKSTESPGRLRRSPRSVSGPVIDRMIADLAG